MVVLGLHVGHGASAAVMIDGEIKIVFQEERFTKIKNFQGYPKISIKKCLDYIFSLKLEINIAAFSSKYYFGFPLKHPIQNFFNIKDFKGYYGEEYYNKILEKKSTKSYINKLKLDKRKKSKYYLNFDHLSSKQLKNNECLKKILCENLLKQAKKKIKKIVFLDHHECHANYAYYSINRNEIKNKKIAVLTIDSMGDYINQTLWISQKNYKLKNINKSNQCDLARIYKLVTLVLSMKPNEHEYKVMGMAPYSKKNYSIKVYNDVFKDLLKIKNCKIVHKNRPKNLYLYLKKKLEPYRFDNIAGALQFFLETIVSQLIKNIYKKYKVNNFALSGGVSMNIKMNKYLHQQKFVKKIYVAPTGTDDSLSIGACYSVNKINTKSFRNIYLGQRLTNNKEELLKKINLKLKKNRYLKLIKNPGYIQIAKLLHRGEIIAIAQGREEFGARALGNRSIIANPSNTQLVKKINEMIKNRDFWMPFALTILKKKHKLYLKNNKNISSEFMTIGFDTHEKKIDQIKAGTHPYDNTVRPQILEKNMNENYYNLIDKFFELSKIPALLNTSLNLHGYPISSTFEDVFYTFMNSGLKFLYLENKYLIAKV